MGSGCGRRFGQRMRGDNVGGGCGSGGEERKRGEEVGSECGEMPQARSPQLGGSFASSCPSSIPYSVRRIAGRLSDHHYLTIMISGPQAEARSALPLLAPTSSRSPPLTLYLPSPSASAPPAPFPAAGSGRIAMKRPSSMASSPASAPWPTASRERSRPNHSKP